MALNGKPLGQMVIKLGLDTSAFSDSLTGASRAVKTSAREMQASFKIAEAGGSKLDALKTKQEGLTKVIQAQKNELGYLKEAYNKTLDAQGNVTSTTAKAAQKYNDALAKLGAYENQIKSTAGQMAEIQVKTTGFTGALNDFGNKAQAVGKQASSLGSSLTKGVTAPIALGVGMATKAAISWESAFAGVKKTNDEVKNSNGEVVYSYKDLENGLRGLAKQLPSSHEKIAEVAETAGQLGIQTKNVVSFTKTMIDMGESTNLSANDAATALAKLANITQMPQTEFSRLGSSMVALGNNFATTESDIADMSLRLAGAGHQVGMSEADIVGLAAALSSVGIEAEAGGSAISKVMVNMQLAVETGSKAFEGLQNQADHSGVSMEKIASAVRNGGKELTSVSKTMGLTTKELSSMYKTSNKSAESLANFADVAGMSSTQFAKAFKEDAAGALTKFIEGLGQSEKKGKSAIQVLNDMGITEVRMRDALLRSAGAGKVMNDAISMSNKAWQSNTALTKEATTRYETTESKLKMLKNQVKDTAIDLGGPFVDALRSGLKAAEPLIKTLGNVAQKFSDMNPKTQETIVKMLGLAAATGPVLSIFGKASSVVGNLSTSFVDLAAKIAKKNAMKEAGTSIAEIGTSAVASSGKISGLASSFSLLNPWVLGTAAVVGGGIAVWKLWGEEAWNSAQRTSQWGRDVGSATDQSLTKVQNYSRESIGEMTLMEQGLSNNVGSIVTNFQKIGSTIETDVKQQITSLKDSLKGLPDDVKDAAEDIVNEAVQQKEESLKIVEENNKQIEAIRKRASDNNRNTTLEEAKQIKDIMVSSASEYLEISGVTADKRKEIMASMTGDVKNASEEQAKTWLVNLGKQRQEQTLAFHKNLDDYKQHLKETGVLNTEVGKKLVELFENSSQASTDAIDTQMSNILKKYPELQKEVLLSTGQLAETMSYAQASVVSSANQKMLSSIDDMSSKIAESASKNAKSLGLMGDESTKAGQKWNAIILDEKTGKVKTNAVEEVEKATQSNNDWMGLAFGAKEAKLDSNAKLVIAEAALANNHWGSLEFMGKKALIESNATRTIIEATQQKGIWENLSFDQKKALLYSDTPEKVAQAVSDMGLWDKLSPQVKKLKADNYDLLSKLNESKTSLETFNSQNPTIKKLLADESEYKPKVEDATNLLKEYNALPEDLKILLSNNEDMMSKVKTAQSTLDIYNLTKTPEKILQTNNSDAVNKTNEAKNGLNQFNQLPTPVKNLKVNSDTTGVTLAKQAIDSIPPYSEKTIALIYKAEQRGKANPNLYGPGYATGTNYHPGGSMIVNDQKGPLYKELVQYPNGLSFIAEGRNVVIPHAPRGAKVYKASETKKRIPRYADGVGVPRNSQIVRQISMVNNSVDTPSVTVNTDNTKMESKLDTMINLLSLLLDKNSDVYIDKTLAGKVLSDSITEAQNRKNRTQARLGGVR